MCQNDNPDSNCVTKLFVLRFKILKTLKIPKSKPNKL